MMGPESIIISIIQPPAPDLLVVVTALLGKTRGAGFGKHHEMEMRCTITMMRRRWDLMECGVEVHTERKELK